MNGLQIPIFEKGNIVTVDMLEAVKALPLDYQSAKYAGYSNGILTGCKVDVNDSNLVIREGIMVYEGQLYFITQPITLAYRATNEWQLLQLTLENETVFRNVRERKIIPILTGETGKRADYIELCRFRLQEGAMLRNSHRRFRDMETEYDTINEIYAEWSSYSETTISYRLLEAFVKEMEKKESMEIIDFLFCQQVYQLNGEAMNRKAIESYINQRALQKQESYTNQDIYNKLVEILHMNRGNARMNTDRPMRMNRIIVD